LPLITAAIMLYRGFMTASNHTFSITISMAANLSLLMIILIVGVLMNIPGIIIGAVALTVSFLAEFLTIYFAHQRLH